MAKQINKFDGSFLQGVAFGDNNTINNYKSSEEYELEYFAECGQKRLEQLDPEQKEYMILNTAVVYAKRKKKNELVKTLKQHSLDVWEAILANVASAGLIELIKRWCA